MESLDYLCSCPKGAVYSDFIVDFAVKDGMIRFGRVKGQSDCIGKDTNKIVINRQAVSDGILHKITK